MHRTLPRGVRNPLQNIAKLAKGKNLPESLYLLLEYHQEHVNPGHYSLPDNCDDFVHGDLFDLALEYKPLLFAIVAFSAYLKSPEKPVDYIQHYLESITLLRKSIVSGEKNPMIHY